ncbi:MAG TPA: PQQ-dependent sugar dehydrogenase [Solirubrobacteraceae bacterium]
MHGRLSLLLLGAVAAGLVACGATSADPGGPARGTAQAAATRLVTVGRFDAPLYVTAPPGDARRLMVVEQRGRIRVVRGGRTLATPFLDITSKVTSGGEQGLLGLAFAPDYGTSGLFYVYYTGRDQREWVVEYHRASADRADPASARTVLRMDDPESNHNGGNLQFGPDGLLYIGTGDGGGANDQHGARGNAQNLGSLLGKLLRIDPKASGSRPYTVPASNPFTGRAGARPEVYSYGLRNPWRFSFDRATGDLSIGDVGQDAVEEIDFAREGRARGTNYGWRPWEGRRRNFSEPAPGAVFPVITKSHQSGWCSIIGGYVVRDPKLPALRGRYVYSDNCLSKIYAAKLRARGASGDHALALPALKSVSSFGQDDSGRIYIVSLDGPVYRLVAGS